MLRLLTGGSRSPWSAVVLLLGGLAVCAGPAGAQSPRRVPGFWFGAAAGIASGGFRCDGCSGGHGGPTAALVLGRTFSPTLALGVEANGWWRRPDAAVEHLGYLTLTGWVFPRPRSGLFLTGGLGLARGSSVLERDGGGRDRASATSLGWTLGAGYDLRVGSELALAPFVSYAQASAAELKVNGFPSGERLSHRLVRVGVGLFWNFSGAIAFPAPTAAF